MRCDGAAGVVVLSRASLLGVKLLMELVSCEVEIPFYCKSVLVFYRAKVKYSKVSKAYTPQDRLGSHRRGLRSARSARLF